MVSFCPRCGAEGGFGAAGCRRCGHQFAGWAVFADLGPACARCGHQGPADASYCVRCGTPAPEARFNDDDTVFFRRDAAQGFQAVQAVPRPAGRVCVVCGQRNVQGDEFCAHCETILPMAEGDTVPPRRASAPSARVPIPPPATQVQPPQPLAPAARRDVEASPSWAIEEGSQAFLRPFAAPVSAPVPQSLSPPPLPDPPSPAPYFTPVVRIASLIPPPPPPPPPTASAPVLSPSPVPAPATAPSPEPEPVPVPALAPAHPPPAPSPLTSPPEVDPEATVHWPASAVAAVRAAAGQRPEPDGDDVQETRQLTEDDYDTRILDDTPMTAAARRDPQPGRRRLTWAALSVSALAIAATAVVAYMSTRPAGVVKTAPSEGGASASVVAPPVMTPPTAASAPASTVSRVAAKAARRSASAAGQASAARQVSRSASTMGWAQPSKGPLQSGETPPPPAARRAAASMTDATPAGPAAIVSVQASCSVGNGFISEQLCRVRLCQQPEHARDPVCIEHRRMEAQSRRDDAP